MYACIRACVYVCMCVCVYVYVYMYMYVYVCRRLVGSVAMRFSRGRMEGRALEHGFVAWARSRDDATDVNRARKIRMLFQSDTVELVEDVEI